MKLSNLMPRLNEILQDNLVRGWKLVCNNLKNKHYKASRIPILDLNHVWTKTGKMNSDFKSVFKVSLNRWHWALSTIYEHKRRNTRKATRTVVLPLLGKFLFYHCQTSLCVVIAKKDLTNLSVIIIARPVSMLSLPVKSLCYHCHTSLYIIIARPVFMLSLPCQSLLCYHWKASLFYHWRAICNHCQISLKSL